MTSMTDSRFNLPIPYGWYAVAMSNALKAGESMPASYFGEELVLFRTQSGKAKVLNAICPHLGAHLGYGSSVKGESLACPFHGWEFNGDGICTDVPYAQQMPPRVADGKQCIRNYPVVEMAGAIWAWYHPEGAGPLFEIEDVAELSDRQSWSEPTVTEWRINAPVQEMGENAVDKAHFETVHNIAEMPASDIRTEGHRRTSIMDMRQASYNEDGTRNEDELMDRNITTISLGPGYTLQRFIGLCDIVMLGTVTPIDAETTLLRFVTVQSKDISETGEIIAQAMLETLNSQVEQDIPIWNHKHYQENPILCDGDGPIAMYRKWFSQFYA